MPNQSSEAAVVERAVPDSLKALASAVQQTQGFAELLAALRQGNSATVDGAWNSAAALVAAALSQHVPKTLVIALAHPRDVDSWIEDLWSFTGIRAHHFPAWDAWPIPESVADEIGGQRLRLLKQLGGDAPHLLVTTIQALVQPVPDHGQLDDQRKRLRVGQALDLEAMTGWLVEHGFQRMEAVELPGEFSRRGGILDVYSADAEDPFRIEFAGDDIESIRQFSATTQRSLADHQAVDVTAPLKARREGSELPRGHLCDYLPSDAWTFLLEPGDLGEQGKHFLERVADVVGLFSLQGTFQQLLRFPSIHVTRMPATSTEAICHLKVESVERFSGDVTKLRDELDSATAGDLVVIACHNEAEKKRLGDVLASGQLAQSDRLKLLLGRVHAGFRMVDAGIAVLGDHELFHREEARTIQPRRRLESRAIDSFLDLHEGDLVVHLSHGIARFLGMKLLEKNGETADHLILEFSGHTYVYVPASKIDLVQKYIGGGKVEPELSKVGGVGWARRKERVEAAVLDLASEMVDLQARRESQPGMAFPPDTEWQAEFEAAFPYEETPDQLTSLGEIKHDMEKARPMDRLICGDVGYGKTELAIRAAFKTIDNGKQVAVLVPTTVLAEQHYRTFSQRLADYPFNVDCISRFRTHGQQTRIIEKLGKGGIDIIIGTHRLVSADVKFKDLGLVIIDEEQRFGVEHKERLKQLRQTVDVLTMTATPIPRTLHLSLLGIRDISNLETPPRDRLAIETRIARFDPTLVRHAIVRELNREGQIYFVHNRVQNIHEIAAKIQEIVPEAKIVVGHGQMDGHELEEAMVKFVRRDADILVATTIIESGLDIANANTIFINQADNYGLADLHQLRGRVGRYKHRAYAYLLLDSNKAVSPNASRRLKAIEEFTELGAGFKIAMRDLEIRGAGNILGTQQSGHIAAVGYELYCQLLENAVRLMKNQPVKTHLEVNLDLPFPAVLPRDYIPGQKQKIEVYRRLARVRKLDRLEDFRQELRDRFGPIPEAVEWLLRAAEIRLLAAHWQIASVHLEGKTIKEKNRESFDPAAPLDLVLKYRNPKRIQKLAERAQPRLRVVDAESAYFRLAPPERAPLGLYQCLKTLLRLPDRSL